MYPQTQSSSSSFSAGLHESYLRSHAIKTTLPTYPEEAKRLGISEIVQLKLEIGSNGKVLRIKVNPKTNRLLASAAAAAARKWEFKPHVDRGGLDRPVLGRLTFHFRITDGVGTVALFQPPLNAPDHKHLGYFNSSKEFKEWGSWEEVTVK
jgi:TonB family protein